MRDKADDFDVEMGVEGGLACVMTTLWNNEHIRYSVVLKITGKWHWRNRA